MLQRSLPSVQVHYSDFYHSLHFIPNAHLIPTNMTRIKMQYITPHHVSSCDLFICKADQEREERERAPIHWFPLHPFCYLPRHLNREPNENWCSWVLNQHSCVGCW